MKKVYKAEQITCPTHTKKKKPAHLPNHKQFGVKNEHEENMEHRAWNCYKAQGRWDSEKLYNAI